MVIGPSSSRLVTASSVFVQQVQVTDIDRKGVFLYSFSEKPELSSETNWSSSNYLIIGSYSRKGFSFWLNKGSRIKLRLEAQTKTLNQIEIVTIKGEKRFETLLPKLTTSTNTLVPNEPINGKEAEFIIEEDDKYYLDIINTNSRSIIMTLNLNVSSKMYDISKANDKCSTRTGSCQLRLLFPSTHYVILTTPNNGDLGGWYLELSFVARVVTYIAILGFITIIILIIIKYLGTCDAENTTTDTAVEEINETHPILPEKPSRYTYGTVEDDEESVASSSSEELYDAKLCVICYDDQRNCFFVPCGHCATCYDCAQRIMEGESKVCPICRRLIHKVRRLFSS
ncbi:E3 ubiquitin-protein ligase APD2 isoform X2 [Ziziphus jujuba]|nr:E3 ubiquitin-protein ligase APD2 isoform X2 [Ziziphus jujuba]